MKNIRAGTPISTNSANKNRTSRLRKKAACCFFQPPVPRSLRPAVRIWLTRQGECRFQARGVERVESDRRSVTRRAGPVQRAVGCRRPSATPAGPGHWSSPGAYRGRDVTKAGMRGTMVHSLADVLKQLGVSAFNRRGRLPLTGSQSIVCSPLWTEKVVFCKGAVPTIMWWLFPPQPAVSIGWMDSVADMAYMFVCGLEGDATEEESNPLSLVESGRSHTHTAYHKGASGRRNVYMMSNDSPKIGLSS